MRELRIRPRRRILSQMRRAARKRPEAKDMNDFMDVLEQAAYGGVIECPECGELIEPDGERCACGWKNPLIEMGMI